MGIALLLALILSISFYHGPTTAKFITPAGNKLPFDYSAYVQVLADEGVGRTRVFAELPWLWKIGTNGKLKASFNPGLSIFPFAYLPEKKTWDFERANVDFFDRTQVAGAIAKDAGMEILICFATQGPDFGCSYFSKMGYSNPAAYYTDGDSNFYRSSGAWQKLLNHFRTVARATRGYSRQYRYFEPFNEQKSIVVTSELRGLKKAVNSVRGKYRMQLNVPNPLYPVPGFLDTSQYLFAVRKLLNGDAGIRIARVSFHGIFTAEGVRRLAGLLRSSRISPGLCEISTDGATPWKGRFTEQSHAGHQDARLEWKKSSASIRAVIDAHVEIVRAAKQEGFAVCDIQDLIKWTGDLDSSDADVRRLHREIVHAAR